MLGRVLNGVFFLRRSEPPERYGMRWIASKRPVRFVVDMVLESLESLGLGFTLLMASPLAFLRAMDSFFSTIPLYFQLAPRNLFAAYIKANLDSFVGNSQRSSQLIGQICSSLEDELGDEKSTPALHLRALLIRMYSRLLQASLENGRLDEAAAVVIRANQKLGADRLPASPNLDVKTAHVIKAGIAAGKLLEDGGLATLFVKSGQESTMGRNHRRKSVKKTYSSRKPNKEGATIIPFPSK